MVQTHVIIPQEHLYLSCSTLNGYSCKQINRPMHAKNIIPFLLEEGQLCDQFEYPSLTDNMRYKRQLQQILLKYSIENNGHLHLFCLPQIGCYWEGGLPGIPQHAVLLCAFQILLFRKGTAIFPKSALQQYFGYFGKDHSKGGIACRWTGKSRLSQV